jgi:transcriptional regulator of acetoin/glycerol metabolism
MKLMAKLVFILLLGMSRKTLYRKLVRYGVVDQTTAPKPNS